MHRLSFLASASVFSVQVGALRSVCVLRKAKPPIIQVFAASVLPRSLSPPGWGPPLCYE